jgi:RND family efflux transporter MFP subunit
MVIRSRVLLLPITVMLVMLVFLLWRPSRMLVASLVGTTGRDSSAVDTSTTAIAQIAVFTPEVASTGTVRLSAGARVAVGAQVSGVVRSLPVRQGSPVRRGDLIAQLDDREVLARLSEADARLDEVRSIAEQAERDRRRTEKLAESGGVSPQELETITATAAGAVARLEQAKAERALARLQLEHTRIRAPIDGVVASITTHAGETVAASFSTPNFVTLIDATKLECVALVDESDIGHVAVGDSARFTVDAYPGRDFMGVVDHISPDATIVSGVVDYEVTIRLRGGTDALKPQMTASVNIEGPSRRALVIPQRALRQTADGAYVWVRRSPGSAPIRAPVRVGARQTDVVEVLAGLRAGETVLTSAFPDAR